MDSTNTLDATGSLANRAQSPSLAASLLGNIEQAAIDIGERKRLHCSDGTWMCWECGTECPFHVSLHCEFCLGETRRKITERRAREARRSDADRHWEALCQTMATDSRLTRESAAKLIGKARELQTFTKERMDTLNLCFDRRFSEASPKANWGTYATMSAGEDPAETWDRG